MIPVLVFWENCGKSGKLGPNVSNHGHQYTESHPSNLLNSTFHIEWSLTKIQIQFEGWFTPVLVYLGHLGKSRNLQPNTQIHGHVIHSVKLHISHQMNSHFTSNEALLRCKGHLFGKVIPVFEYLWNWDKLVKLGLNNPNHEQQYRESYQKC